MLGYLILTILVEAPIYFLFNRKNISFSLLVLILANCFTWPILHLLLFSTSIPLWPLEVGVVVVEAFIIYYFLDQKFSKALLIALAQNAVSALLGVWIQYHA